MIHLRDVGMRCVMRLLLLAVVHAGAGCAGTAAPSDSMNTLRPTGDGPISEPAQRWTVPLPPAVSLQRPGDGDYRLAPRDHIAIQVLSQDDLTRTVRVSEVGSVTLPLLGELPVAGLAVEEVETKIAAGLRGRYLTNPRVTVRVTEYAGRKVAVMGAVGQPAAYALKSNSATVLEALAEAKGVRDNADRVAYVMRERPRQGEPQPVSVDLDALLRTGDVRHNVVVEGGDTVFVPEANVYYVAGEVEKRGAYPLRRDTTVSKALAEAGGVTKLAAKDEIKIVRTLPTGQKEEITGLSLSAAMAGDRSQDLPLRPQDVVVVPTSEAKAAAYTVLDIIKGLIFLSPIP